MSSEKKEKEVVTSTPLPESESAVDKIRKQLISWGFTRHGDTFEPTQSVFIHVDCPPNLGKTQEWEHNGYGFVGKPLSAFISISLSPESINLGPDNIIIKVNKPSNNPSEHSLSTRATTLSLSPRK